MNTNSPTRATNIAIFAIAFGLTLTGCAVSPNYQAPTVDELLPGQFPVQAQAHNAGSPIVAAQWWHTFNDAALNELVEVALKHSPDLEAADANIRQSRAALGQISGQGQPQLNADGRLGRDQISRNGEQMANIPFPNPKLGFTEYKLGLDASWEIDLFGHRARSVESASARLGGIEQQRADATLRIAAETARNVLDYRYWQLRLDNAKQVLALQQEALRLTQLQQQAGVASSADVRIAEVNLHNAEANLPSLEAGAQSAIAALGPLTALPNSEIATTLAKTNNHPTLPTSFQADLSSELLLRRPDVRIAERNLAAATADLGVAITNQYPRITLMGQAGWDGIQPGQLFEQASRYWNLGPQFSIPLLSGGAIQSQIEANTAARDAALANYRKAVLAALADAESTMVRCQADHRRGYQLSLSRKNQDETLKFAEQRFKVGDTSKLEWIGAQLQSATLQDQQLSVEQTMATDVVTFYKALGGGV